MRFDLAKVTRGRNLDLIGWNNGYMLVQFRGRSTQYVFGPGIPQDEHAKLLRSPFPDRLFQTNIKSKYQCAKMGETQ